MLNLHVRVNAERMCDEFAWSRFIIISHSLASLQLAVAVDPRVCQAYLIWCTNMIAIDSSRCRHLHGAELTATADDASNHLQNPEIDWNPFDYISKCMHLLIGTYIVCRRHFDKSAQHTHTATTERDFHCSIDTMPVFLLLHLRRALLFAQNKAGLRDLNTATLRTYDHFQIKLQISDDTKCISCSMSVYSFSFN